MSGLMKVNIQKGYRKMIKKTLIVVSLSLVSCLASAEGKSPRLSGGMFEFGGGQLPLPPSRIHSIRDQAIGISWDANMACGEFDPQITIANQLNGITDGFKNMMGNIISAATGAVASLPGLALQKASPELYDMLQQGILQGKMDFEWAETSCEEMQRVILGQQSFPFENYKLSASAGDWSEQIGGTDGDAVEAVQNLDEIEPGKDGSDWVCGVKKGGKGQEPIETIKDVVIVGYNIMYDRTNSCSTASVSATLSADSPLAAYWGNPLVAGQWAVSVLGDMELRICSGCKKFTGIPGKGLVYKHRIMVEEITDDLIDLVDGNVASTYANLERVSALPGVIIRLPVISSIRKRTASNRLQLITKIASEIAYVRLVEQAKLTTRMLMAGIREPNAAAQQDAVTTVYKAVDQLQIELDQLQLEIKVREDVSGGTIKKLLLLDEKHIQDTSPAGRGAKGSTDALGNPVE
jgi:integrating conjugative element protein (TIGR03755 family)